MSLLKKAATHSDEYVQRLSKAPKLSSQQKVARLGDILSDEQGGLQRLGQGMVGPIQIRLRYEGITRNVLVEDTLERGPLMPYDILDDLGRAYILNTTDDAVKITPFEGKQAPPQLFRIASFPRIRKEDLYFLRVNAVEYAQDETRQAIQKQEDARLVLLLEQAVVQLGQVRANQVVGAAPTGGRQVGIAAGPSGAPTEQTVLVGAGNSLEPGDFYNAVSQININQLEARRVIAHPIDIRDLYTWDINATGFRFKDDVFAGGRITSFGEFQIQQSIIIPQGELFLLGEPNFLGVFPVMYSLDVEENHRVDHFYKGWVMDEMVGMLILNPRSISRILKADSTAAPQKLDITGFGY